jgi:hypothetical protein
MILPDRLIRYLYACLSQCRTLAHPFFLLAVCAVISRRSHCVKIQSHRTLHTVLFPSFREGEEVTYAIRERLVVGPLFIL